MLRNHAPLFRSSFCFAVAALAIPLGVLAAPVVPVAAGKDNPEDFTQIYRHTYDDVFQAAQEAIERRGCVAKDVDKDKGTVTGSGACVIGGNGLAYMVEFEIHIEPVSPKPETRVTVDAKVKVKLWAGQLRKKFANELLSEISKVLSTYK